MKRATSGAGRWAVWRWAECGMRGRACFFVEKMGVGRRAGGGLVRAGGRAICAWEAAVLVVYGRRRGGGAAGRPRRSGGRRPSKGRGGTAACGARGSGNLIAAAVDDGHPDKERCPPAGSTSRTIF